MKCSRNQSNIDLFIHIKYILKVKLFLLIYNCFMYYKINDYKQN